MPGERSARRRRLVDVAASQSGYFSAAQALRLGYSYQAQKYHADQDNWHRAGRGLFRLPEWPIGMHEDLAWWELWSGGRAVVSHDSALVVHDLGDVNPARVHLTVPVGFNKRDLGAILHRGVLPDADVSSYEGFKVTTPLRSLLDVAGGHLDLDLLAGAVHEALDRGMVTRRKLLVRADELDSHTALRIEQALNWKERNAVRDATGASEGT